MGTDRERLERQRRAVVLAAAEVITQAGLSGADERAIARRAGVTPALIRHLFPSREALVEAAVEELLPGAELESALAPMRHESPRDALSRIARLVMSLGTDPPGRQALRTLLREACGNPEAARLVWDRLLRPVVAALAAYLVERAPTGDIRVEDPAVFAHAFVVSVAAFALAPLVWPEWPAAEFGSERLLDGIVETFHRGLTQTA